MPLPYESLLESPGPRSLRVVPLGGLGEIGMNCLAIEQDDGIIVVDCGVTFPSSDLGIDLYHPRFDYLAARSDRVLGIVLTHGHEDHIGAIPYALGVIDAPVLGPPHALELARLRLREHGFDLDELDLIETPTRKTFKLGSFTIEPIRVTHSIADATALAIRTKAGLVVHTGDFKLDPAPPDGEVTDEARFEALGDEGVRLLLSDSTSIDSTGTSRSERDVAEALGDLVARARTRVVVGVFASNVQRLRVLGDIAQRTGRRICLLGRSVGNHARVAEAVARLKWPSDLVVPPDVAMAMPRERVLAIASGTQAERNSALPRLAAGAHPAMRLDPGDVVILSSRIIPGNDRFVFEMMGDFLRLGVELVTRVTHPNVHASGHAHRDEQLRMIEMTRPRAFVPLHGTVHHLHRHAALARDAGVGDVMVVENGEAFEIEADSPLRKVGRAPFGKVATFAGEALADEVLRERGLLGRHGAAFVSVVLDKRGVLAGTPQVAMRGVISDNAAATASTARKVAIAVARSIADAEPRLRAADDALAEISRSAARRAIEAETRARPIVTVVVTRL